MYLQMLIDFLTNPLFLAGAGSWLAAQLTKLILSLIRHESADKLLTGGGMPSSHTATVMGLLTETALCYGTAGFEFPMALFFMIMVVYDSLNVRYITGEQNKLLNHMTKELGKKEDGEYYRRQKKLKELLGHTLPEVLVGAVVGITVAVLVKLLPL